MYDDMGEGNWNLEVIRIVQTFTLLQHSRAKRARKNYNNKIKTTFGPPLLPINHIHKTPPLTNLGGGVSGPPVPPVPPLDTRMYEKGKRDSSGMCVPQTGEVTLPSPAVAHNSLMGYFN